MNAHVTGVKKRRRDRRALPVPSIHQDGSRAGMCFNVGRLLWYDAAAQGTKFCVTNGSWIQSTMDWQRAGLRHTLLQTRPLPGL